MSEAQVAAAALPWPGDELVKRVTGVTDRHWFYESGHQSVLELEKALSLVTRPLASFESILDFGTGCGRMMLWLEELGRTRSLHGTDIDSEAIAWARDNISFATFAVNQADPPLPYEDASFDLVFNHSVFTHIDRTRQDAWLTELQRVTRPGGLLLLSVHGEHAIPAHIPGLGEQVQNEGIVFVDHVHPEELGFPDWYQASYHAPWYVFEHWTKWFDIRAYLPVAALGFQDQVLLERRATDRHVPLVGSPPAPVAPGPAERSHRRSAAFSARDFARRTARRVIRPFRGRQT